MPTSDVGTCSTWTTNLGAFGRKETYLALGKANRNDTKVLRVGEEATLNNVGIHCGNVMTIFFSCP
jgi:hypothetical protein